MQQREVSLRVVSMPWAAFTKIVPEKRPRIPLNVVCVIHYSYTPQGYGLEITSRDKSIIFEAKKRFSHRARFSLSDIIRFLEELGRDYMIKECARTKKRLLCKIYVY